MGVYIERYGIIGFIQLMYYRMFTALFFPSARLIRLPIDIRHKSNIDFGTGLTCGRYCRFEVHPGVANKHSKLLVFGKNVQVNDFVHIAAVQRVTIGDNVLIASKVFISDSNHGDYSGAEQSHPSHPPIERKLSAAPVEIGNNVWIGEFVSILQGVKIGEGTIIGSMSVVTKDIPANCIAVGSPAKIIKRFNFETAKWEKA
jgi:acetyltransferase-like isoleucine patch superfamily enzyme